MILPGNRDPKAEWEQQSAFEQAERERAERRARAVFDSFVDACPVAVELFDPDGRLLRSNRTAERLLGKVPPPGLSLFDPRGLKRTGLLEPQLKRVLAGARVETPPTWYDPVEIGLPPAPGGRVCFRATVLPLFDAENTVTGIAVIYENVTAAQTRRPEPEPGETAVVPEDVRDLEFRRRKLEQALRESEERFRAFVENARGYVVFRFGEDGRLTAVSPSVHELWGVSAEAMLVDPSTFFAQVIPEDAALVRETEARARTSGNWPELIRFRIRSGPGGDIRWVELHGSTASIHGQRFSDAVAFDVTRLLELEQRCVRADSSLVSITGSPVDGFVTLDTDLKVLSWSTGAEAATALRAEEAQGRPLAELFPDFERIGFLPAIRRTLHEQKTERHESFHHDGRERHAGWYALSSYPFETGVLLLIRNTTERHRAALNWRRSEERLQALLASPGLLVSLKDRDLRYRLANPLALHSLGLAADAAVETKTDADLLKKTVAGLIAEHDRQALVATGPVELELALPDAVSEQAAWYRLVKTPFRDADGEVMGVLTVGWDISRQVHAFQELARRRSWLEKHLAEQGRLADEAGRELGRWQKWSH